MVQLSIGELAEIVGGTLQYDSMPPLGGDLEPLRRVQVDSSRVSPGDVFWGLVQDGQNGAWRAEEAYSRGALGAVVCSRHLTPWAGKFALEVEDTEWALWRLARWTRRQYKGTVVAVLGGAARLTSGMIASAVGNEHCTLTSSSGAGEQHISTLLGLLELDNVRDVAVFDFGAHPHAADARKLARLCRPDILVVLDTGEPPYATGDVLSQVYAEFMAELPRGGSIVIDGDHLALARSVRRRRAEKMLVGRGVHCDLVATDVQFRQQRLSFDAGGASYSVNVCGRHYLASALAACAAAQLAGAAPQAIAAGLAQYQPPPGQRCLTAARRITVIDETGAAPAALFRSLEACGETPTNGRRVVVCGIECDTAQDDEQSQICQRLGRAALERCGADLLIACGPHGAEIVAAAQDAGMSNARTAWFASAHDAAQQIESLLAPGDLVLVAGSPRAELSRVVESLTTEKKALAAAA